MDAKKIIVWVVGIVVVAGVAYYGYKWNAAKQQAPANTQAAAGATPEQVQGQDIKVGTGDEAKPGMRVTVEYTGKLSDGTVFDTSVGKAPLVFILGAPGIIPGFQVGVNGMKVGGERYLAIPPSLAYGAQKVNDVPANSTLIFDVKLLKVESAPAPAPASSASPSPAAPTKQ